MTRSRARCGVALAVLAGGSILGGPPADPADKFEAEVRKFEERDKTDPPPKGAILFYGSSTIAKWNIANCFPGLATINRGIGGTHVSDALRFAERIAIPYAPRVIVFYAGDNDLAARKAPGRVFEDFQAFVKKIRGALPATRIVFISIKPSPSRWALWPEIQEANQRVAEFGKTDPKLDYLNIAPATLGADGKPDPALFQKDGLHLNEKSYAAWSALLKPLLAEPAKPEK